MELHKYWGVGGRRCGACEAAPAAVHCRTCGGVFLCTACDARPAHAGHERVWVCEVCELAPAAVTCKADAAVLCAACDADIHDANPLARRHTRVPIAPIGSTAAVESMLFGTAGEAAAEEQKGDEQQQQQHQQHNHHGHQHQHALNLNVEAKDMKLDYLFSDLDPYLNVELPRFQHADSVVPSGVAAVELDFTGGIGVKQSSYSSYTATSLAHSGSSSEVGVVPDTICIGAGGGSFELDFTRPKPQAYMPYTATPPSHSVSSVDAEVVPEQRGDAAAVPRPLVGEGREARLMRYREKRKNRRFEKTIRYASRKAYAETRPRIKGRFAKRADNDADDADAEAEAVVAVPSASSSYMLDFGYSVVPSF